MIRERGESDESLIFRIALERRRFLRQQMNDKKTYIPRDDHYVEAVLRTINRDATITVSREIAGF